MWCVLLSCVWALILPRLLFPSQITGYDSTDVQKGAVKTVSFADSTFDTAPVLKTLYVALPRHLARFPL